MRYRNAISYAILLVIAYDIKDIANAIKKISHEISLRYRNDAISHAISHLSRIQMTAIRPITSTRHGSSAALAAALRGSESGYHGIWATRNHDVDFGGSAVIQLEFEDSLALPVAIPCHHSSPADLRVASESESAASLSAAQAG